MINTVREHGKTYAPIHELKNWDKNPRVIKKRDFDRIKKQLQDLGEYKPIIVTPEGTVLGGNMRLRAYRELGYKSLWVSVVEPPDKATEVAYALSDNDRGADYVENDLAELISSVKDDLDLSLYSIDLGKFTYVDDFINIVSPTVNKETKDKELFDCSEGDTITLGGHKLTVGKNTDEVTTMVNAWEKLTGEKAINLQG